MKKLLFIFFTMISLTVSASVFAGNCEHPWDRASDGSSCGGRSSDSRPGGD